MRLLLIIFSILFFGQSELPAQARKKKEAKVETPAQKHWKSGIKARKEGKSSEAISDFEKAIKSDPKLVVAYFDLGALYFKLDSFQLAIENFKTGLSIKKDASPSIHFTIGQAYWVQNMYDSAAVWFDKTLNQPELSTNLAHKARKFKRDALFYLSAPKMEADLSWHKLGEAINSEHPEYLPTLTADGKTLIFTRRIQRQEDFYITYKDEKGDWETSVSLENLNSPNNEGAICISADGKKIIFALCNDKEGFGGCDLYEVIEKKGVWGYPVNLGSNINSNSWDSQPSLSPDGNTLYFVSNRPDGYGDNDIWFSIKGTDGKWGKAQNAGPIVNSDGNELTPLIHFDGQTMYFSSEGHPGYGGFDLFKSTKQADKKWGIPINLGAGINSKGDESGLAVSIDGKTAILTRLVEDNEQNIVKADLYTAQLPDEVKARPASYSKIYLKAQSDSLPISGIIEVIDLLTGLEAGKYMTNDSGEALVILQKGLQYAVQSSHPGYMFASLHFNIPADYDKDDIPSVTLFLQPIKDTSAAVAKPVVLNNVFYETGSASLQKISFVELNKLTAFLNENPSVKVRINGHTDNVGKDDVNNPLSEARAKSVYDYLIKQGIDASRMQFKGFGSSKPIADNNTEAGRAQNRRTEYEILN
jgi:outer membrane protein OmpA-like peptidoglycan-associated protein